MTPVVVAAALLCPPGPASPCREVAFVMPGMADCRARLPVVVANMARESPGMAVVGRPRCQVVEEPTVVPNAGGEFAQ